MAAAFVLLADWIRPIKGVLIAFALIAIVFYGFASALMLVFGNKLMFHPPRWPDDVDGMIMLKTAKDSFGALYLPPPNDTAYVILYSHGNGQTLSSIQHLLHLYHDKGYGVLGYDYTGYGASTGKPNEADVYRCIESAYHYLVETQKIAPERILSVGYSLGTGAASYISAKRKTAGLFLEAPFSTVVEAVIPFRIPVNHFKSIDRIRKINCPLIVIHGGKDTVVSCESGKKLFKAAREPKEMVYIPEGTHYNLRECLGDRYWTLLAKLPHLTAGDAKETSR
ncbi:MAG: alpha/beta hydrolase [Kiritimatiellae bacterium]|nr:alpha/beta hydrolase [Kiritimatiellia bacterium]MBP5226571.1 alpha/beta hydrolase [Kiritimatiellia bacterium]